MNKFYFTLAFCVFTSSLFAQTKIDAESAGKFIGEKVTVNGKVTGAFFKNSSKQIVLNVGPSTTNTVFNIVINQGDKRNFSYTPESFLINKNVSLTGKVLDVNGTPGMMVSRPEDIRLDDEDSDSEIRPLSFETFNKFFDYK